MGKHASLAAAGLVACFGLLHAPRLGAPALGRDSWREADTLMVARNFCTEQTSFFFPHVDQRENTDGATGMEFPLLNWAAGKLWCGSSLDLVLVARLLVLCAALSALTFLFLFTRALSGPAVALGAAFVCATSPNFFYYGRSVQPDVPAMAFALAGIVLVERATRRTPSGERPGLHAIVQAAPRSSSPPPPDLAGPSASTHRASSPALWLLAGAAFGFAGLVKLPAIVFGLPALAIAADRMTLRGVLRNPVAWISAAVAALPITAWYRHAQHLQDVSGLMVFPVRKSLHDLWNEWHLPEFWELIFVRNLFDVYAFPLASVAAVLALVHLRSRLPRWVRAFAVAALAFFLLAGYASAHHVYYGVMIAPAIAVLAAHELKACASNFSRPSQSSQSSRLWALRALGALGAAASVWWTATRTNHWFAPPDAVLPIAQVAALLDTVEPNERVVLFSDVDPTLLYHANRKGWLAPPVDEAGWFARWPERPRVVFIDRKYYSEERAAVLRATVRSAGYDEVARVERLEAWRQARPERP
jgi:4-amino-4-deoxy-L-arabinose transferase-like glycosyltransferase